MLASRDPLQEMLHGYMIRCLMCNQVLAIGTVQARKSRGKNAPNADSYFGAKLHGPFCPNFACHFGVANNWLTHKFTLCSGVRLGRHQPTHWRASREKSLRTQDQLSTERHRQTSTPRFSSVTRVTTPMLSPGPVAAGGLIPNARASTEAPLPVDLTQQAHSC
jgi:hypothetical protein